MDKILISACLIGLRTRYDGKIINKLCTDNFQKRCLIPVCPEQLGGLSTPREPADILFLDGSKRAVSRNSKIDLTENFLKGARETLKICKKLNINKAILKSKSPSCGEEGFTFDLLKKNNIRCIIKS
ncbi:MAG: DUF523 domain-containing protein [Candidatus Mcinerneyibacterium aminivorans]|uniref:DUF523 domain-containing protein n=1 Tax=Candidatus Mcinerneyibacterium aminivorans TaxID=2703815 RepID=A0A5D0MFI7_9BACT|nr:MAG: DUF523 domain-containing protein [Candidatus Mcinerneyibacterium aminivorans]